MRNVARLKMGYYSLPESEGVKLRSLLSYSQTASAIDPCVGQGAALQAITKDDRARLYGSNSMRSVRESPVPKASRPSRATRLTQSSARSPSRCST
jgi:hypothetical protein